MIGNGRHCGTIYPPLWLPGSEVSAMKIKTTYDWRLGSWAI